MENQNWKRDDKPYLVFLCEKCKQYSYVKVGQKFKTCLRCGKRYEVSRIINSGEIINGITNALNHVKVKQNELISQINSKHSELRTENDFIITLNHKIQPNQKLCEREKKNIDIPNLFETMLNKLSCLYQEFPRFMIELMAEEYHIPKDDLNLLINNFKLKGILKEGKNQYYKLH